MSKDHVKAVEDNGPETRTVPAAELDAKDARIAELEAAFMNLRSTAAVYRKLAEYQEQDLEGKEVQIRAMAERIRALENHDHGN